MLFVHSKLREFGETCPVLIDSEDTDVVVLCAYVASIGGELSIKRKKAIINCKELCPKEMAKIVVPLHVVTGCDATSSFFGIVKRTIWKRVQNNKELLANLSQDNLDTFVIKYIYNGKSSTCLAEMRAKKWKRLKSKRAKSIARIGPDQYLNTHRNR